LDLPEKNRTGDDMLIKITESEQRVVIKKRRGFSEKPSSTQ
jgi:hypothetical protein